MRDTWFSMDFLVMTRSSWSQCLDVGWVQDTLLWRRKYWWCRGCWLSRARVVTGLSHLACWLQRDKCSLARSFVRPPLGCWSLQGGPGSLCQGSLGFFPKAPRWRHTWPLEKSWGWGRKRWRCEWDQRKCWGVAIW